MNIGIVFIDSEAVIQYCNRAAGVMKRIPQETIVGRKLHTCHPDTLVDRLETIIENMKTTAVPEWQKVIVHDEPYLEHMVSPVFTPEEEFMGMVMVILDISGQRELTDKIEKSERELAALFKVSHTINSSLNLNDVLFKILLLVGEVINYLSGTIYLLDEEKELIIPMASMEGLLGGPEAEPVDFYSPDNIIAFAVRSGEMVTLQRGKPGFGQIPKRPSTNVVLILPLKDKDRCLGVLVVESEDRNIFRLEEQELLATFANHAAVAIKNAQLFTKTKQMAIMDGLTGLYNRQYFDQVLTQTVTQAWRKDSHLTVIMIDVNDLKFINDYFGHIKGDYVIKGAASVVQRSVRDSDTVCRYGGDELVILLPNTSDSEALIIHKRILENVAKWNEEENKYSDIRLSLSIGRASAFGREGINDILTRADQNMYEDKRRYKMGIHEGNPVERAKKQFYFD